MSSRHKRSGGAKKILVWLGWGVLVALLGGNVVLAFINKTGDEPQGFITPDLLLTVAFWTPIAAATTVSILGVYWSSKAYGHSERSSLLWARRGFVFSLVGVAVIALASQDREMFPREWLAVVAAAVVGGQSVFFSMLAFREFRRAAGEGSARRVRSGSSVPTMPPSEAPTESAESPGAGG